MSIPLFACAVVTQWLIGNKDYRGPIVGGLAQFLWLGFGIYKKEIGIILMAFLYMATYGRMWWKWRD